MTALSSAIEPATRAFLEALNRQGGPQIYELSVEEARAVLAGAQAGGAAGPASDIEDRTIPAGPSGEVGIRIVRPQGSRGRLPAVMYFHGGGWVLGDRNTHDRLIREIANGVNAAVVFVDFTRSPEAKYPTAIEEAYAATRYVAENGKALKLDSTRLAVAGDSAGGNMAAAVTLLAKQRGGPKIDYQALFYPVTDGTNFDTASYRQMATGHFLTREAMRWFWNHYLADAESAGQSTASPLLASEEELSGLPPALVITAEYDVLRDEGEAYAHKLAQSGVAVTAVRYLGTMHDFVMLNALASTPAARSAIALANEQLRKALATQVRRAAAG
ncbi:MAG: alpha/beta hydrolase [Bryobacteraceae bacterium]|nr:alpha/beta hydrolase [Bryobacteraceae bacterium]